MPPAASQVLPKLWIRLPIDAKKWLAQQARRNASSQTSEIVRCIRERMDREIGDAARAAALTVTGFRETKKADVWTADLELEIAGDAHEILSFATRYQV